MEKCFFIFKFINCVHCTETEKPWCLEYKWDVLEMPRNDCMLLGCQKLGCFIPMWQASLELIYHCKYIMETSSVNLHHLESPTIRMPTWDVVSTNTYIRYVTFYLIASNQLLSPNYWKCLLALMVKSSYREEQIASGQHPSLTFCHPSRFALVLWYCEANSMV
jgi:hypothetical protein